MAHTQILRRRDGTAPGTEHAPPGAHVGVGRGREASLKLRCCQGADGTSDASRLGMSTEVHGSTDPGGPLELPRRGPSWTFYVFTVLAVLVAIATYFGVHYAGISH